MKKIVSLLLVLMLLVSSVAVLSACGEKGNPALENAKNVVFSMYKDKVSTPADYELVSQVKTVDGTFTVTWEADNATNVKMNAPENNMVKVEITPSRDADVSYNLTATIADAKGNTMTVTFACTIPQDKSLGNDKPVVGTAYKYYINQVTLGKILFFNGKMDGEYLGTTEDPSVSPDVFSEEVDGGYRFYFMNGTTKTYIQIYKNSNDKIRPQLATEPTMVYSYDETVKVFYATIGETYHYLGTYGTWSTFSASETWRITGSNASTIGATQFPGMFTKTANLNIVEKTDAEKVAIEKENLTINTEVKSDSTITLPVVGSTYDDVTVAWEIVGEAACASLNGNALAVTLQKAATSFTVKATITCGEESATKEFTVEVAKIPTIVPQAAENPVAGTAYKLVYFHTTNGVYYYFNGSVGSYYGNMSDVMANAVDVYREDTEGGYFIYFFDKNNVKTYIEAYMSGTYCNLKLNTETPASVWSDHAEHKVPVVTLGTETYFLGSYGTNSDLRPSKISYITQGNYVADFCVLVDTDNIASDVKVSAEKESLKAPVASITEAGSTNLVLEGATYSDVVISWAVSGSELASIVDGKLVISELPAEDATLTLTATLTVGEVTDTKEFTITLKAKVAAPSGNTVAFEFGTNTAGGTHNDGTKISATSKSYTSGDYTLTITDLANIYEGQDGQGNAMLKFGTSSAAGSLTFVVGDDVTSVVIYAARYKNYADNGTVSINGTNYTLQSNSNDGQYDEIVIDTTVNKTITITSVAVGSGKPRMVINTIEFVIG